MENQEMEKRVLSSNSTKCSNCGASIRYSPKVNNLACESCGSVFEFEKSKDFQKQPLRDESLLTEDNKSWSNESKIFKCESCGAEVVLNSLEYSQNCPYCGNSHVSETTNLPGIKPHCVVPFSFDEESASEKFKAGVKKKFFVPGAFKKNIPRNNIHAIYTPVFSFDVNTRTTYNGVLSESYTVKRSDGSVETKYRRFNISGTKDLKYTDYIVESSSKFNNLQIESILPYNFNEAYKFDNNFISGYVVEHYQDSLDKCYDFAKENMEYDIKRKILSSYSYSSVESFNMDVDYSNEKYLYRLVPTYVFEFKYKEKNYKALMNGQTGKLGSGLPKSGFKIALCIIIPLLLFIGMALLIALS
ncbi:MAG: hypothetical protein IJ008_05795 [Clostridia bacterium]|nr:hypothetical protein [Clostridia bacterium]MBQ8845501.1 hypothetical protein [Clostridia bacterium]